MQAHLSTQGIHHITAISSDPQKTYDFYAFVLGLRLVKKSVNQDDTASYHLFFGNKLGSPGMDLTFFPFQPVHKGQRGTGVVSKISLSVPSGSFDFWQKRFDTFHVRYDEPSEVFGRRRMTFYDWDDQCLELFEIEDLNKEFIANVWITEEVSKTVAIHYFHGATLEVVSLQMMQVIVELLGYHFAESDGQSHRFALDSQVARELIIEEAPDAERAQTGAGTVHHIAFTVEDEKELKVFREKLLSFGLWPTEVIDRYYFKSVYFRTPAGILFELATKGPGFVADEKAEKLGEKLALPPFLEAQRAEIEDHLVPIQLL